MKNGAMPGDKGIENDRPDVTRHRKSEMQFSLHLAFSVKRLCQYPFYQLWANRLWSFVKPLNKRLHILAYPLILKVVNIVSAVELYQFAVA